MPSRGKMVTIRLSKANATLLAQNIDGWADAGACEGGLTPAEHKALASAFSQIMRQVAGAETDLLTPEKAWQELLDKDDRTSPEDAPEMCLITFDELRDLMAAP